MAKTITVTIENGKSTVNLEGFHGKGCAEILAEFAKGNTEVKREKKPEFYQVERKGEACKR